VGKFYCHLVNFVVIRYTSPRFGVLHQEKSGISVADLVLDELLQPSLVVEQSVLVVAGQVAGVDEAVTVEERLRLLWKNQLIQFKPVNPIQTS
jgi:hypothetical protein